MSGLINKLLDFNLIYLVSILMNFSLFLLPDKKINRGKISNFITFITLIISFVSSVYLYVLNNENNKFLELSLILFILLFFIITQKISSSYTKTKITENLILSFIAFLSCTIFHFSNYVIEFILIDLILFFILKYGILSNKNGNNFNISNFITFSAFASALFYLSSFFAIFFNSLILYTISALCILLKAGVFPFLNHIINNKNKNNIPYSILISNYVPVICSIIFYNAADNLALNHFIVEKFILILIILSACSFAICAYKEKNTIKFLSLASGFYVSYSLFYLLFGINNLLCFKLMFLFSYCLLGIYSLIVILKINTKNTKINLNLIKGLYYINKNIAHFLCFFLIIYTVLVPVMILFLNNEIINNRLWLVFVILNIFVLLNALEIIQTICTVNLKPAIKIIKAAKINYIAAFIILIFIFILILL